MSAKRQSDVENLELNSILGTHRCSSIRLYGLFVDFMCEMGWAVGCVVCGYVCVWVGGCRFLEGQSHV